MSRHNSRVAGRQRDPRASRPGGCDSPLNRLCRPRHLPQVTLNDEQPAVGCGAKEIWRQPERL